MQKSTKAMRLEIIMETKHLIQNTVILTHVIYLILYLRCFFQYLAYDDEQWTQVKSHACTNDQNDKKKKKRKNNNIKKSGQKEREYENEG